MSLRMLQGDKLAQMEDRTVSKTKEEDFGKTIQSLVFLGGSIRDVLEHPKFLQKLRRFVERRNFTIFRSERSAEDLFQDICLKLLNQEYEGKLRIPGNVQSVDQFFGWLFFVVRNHHVDTIRQKSAQKREAFRSYKCLDDFDFPALEFDQNQEEILNEFPEFIKSYPREWQLAVRLWLKGRSYRRIIKVLVRLGFPKVSPPTIGHWITKVLDGYRQHLESPGPLKRSIGT